ncbi:MAG TPA: type III secretion system export apparatus subunit SctT [Steroidobacteraceae bacterium]|nr:type III secretion system export apparatus subunit SctT [Steroidobacteraceae bacterium]
MIANADWHTTLITMAILMSRMLVAFSLIPLFVGSVVPIFVRTALVAALALCLLPFALSDPHVMQIRGSEMTLFIAKEAGIGLVLGLLAGIGFWAVYTAGVIIEYQAGLSMAATFDPMTGQDGSITGQLLLQLFVVLFLINGGLLCLIGMLFDSYTVWPISSLSPSIGTAQLADALISALSELLWVAIKMAAPFVIMMMAIEIALGFLSRYAPQLNVFFVSIPLKVALLAGLLLIYASVASGSFGELWQRDVSHLIDRIAGHRHGRG